MIIISIVSQPLSDSFINHYGRKQNGKSSRETFGRNVTLSLLLFLLLTPKKSYTPTVVILFCKVTLKCGNCVSAVPFHWPLGLRSLIERWTWDLELHHWPNERKRKESIINFCEPPINCHCFKLSWGGGGGGGVGSIFNVLYLICLRILKTKMTNYNEPTAHYNKNTIDHPFCTVLLSVTKISRHRVNTIERNIISDRY